MVCVLNDAKMCSTCADTLYYICRFSTWPRVKIFGASQRHRIKFVSMLLPRVPTLSLSGTATVFIHVQERQLWIRVIVVICLPRLLSKVQRLKYTELHFPMLSWWAWNLVCQCWQESCEEVHSCQYCPAIAMTRRKKQVKLTVQGDGKCVRNFILKTRRRKELGRPRHRRESNTVSKKLTLMSVWTPFVWV